MKTKNVKIGDLILEKLNNMLKYLKTIFPEKEETINKFHKDMTSVPIEAVYVYIQKNILSLAKDRDYLIKKLCFDYNVEYEKLTKENKDRINLYIDFFNEAINQ